VKSNLPVIEPHDFDDRDFVGGDAALDFINTVTGRDAEPRDWLDSYERLLEWAGRAGLLPKEPIRALVRQADSNPAAARKALARAKALREALFVLLSALAAGRAPPRASLALLHAQWIEGAKAHELRFIQGGITPELAVDRHDLDLIGALVAYRLVENVLPSPAERLRICKGPNCSWLFIDRSKAGRRRWCDMAVCGNAAKSRRFYAKERARV